MGGTLASDLKDSFHARAAGIVVGVSVAVWLVIYEVRAVAGHLALGTNAYDLSVFDHAIWNIAHGGRGTVSFFGHSILSEHFMPVLGLLAPIYWLTDSPVALLVIQPIAMAAAALLFFRLVRAQGLSPWAATLVTLALLFARRTHSAMAGYFYPEVFQAPLTIALVASWTRSAWRFWPVAVLLLVTKEDAALYVGAFSVFAAFTGRGSRGRAALLGGVAAAWLALAFLVAIPASRAADGLPAANPLLQARYGSPSGAPAAGLLVDRVISGHTAATVANMLLATGFLPLAGITWLVPALPGLLLNLAAAPDSLQSGLMDHYAWPILPWLYLSAAAGTAWLQRRWPRAAIAWLAVIAAASIADNPAVQRSLSRSIPAEARAAREQTRLARGETILAQTNLIPHLGTRTAVFAAGGDLEPPQAADLVLLTTVGNTWPMSSDQAAALIAKYRTDPRYAEEASGPVFVFRLRQ